MNATVARLIAPALHAIAVPATAGERENLARIEAAYADMNDALGAVGLIESGYTASHARRDRDAWTRELEAQRNAVRAGLAAIEADKLSEEDQRAVHLMRKAMEPTDASADVAVVGRCADALWGGLAYTALSEALVACFDEYGNNIEFEAPGTPASRRSTCWGRSTSPAVARRCSWRSSRCGGRSTRTAQLTARIVVLSEWRRPKPRGTGLRSMRRPAPWVYRAERSKTG
jgi:hypothetical protein